MITCSTTWAANLIMAVVFHTGGGVSIRPVTAPIASGHLVFYCQRLPAGFYISPGVWGVRGGAP